MSERRELIEPACDGKRHARRDDRGRFTRNQVDDGGFLAADRRATQMPRPSPGQSDRGIARVGPRLAGPVRQDGGSKRKAGRVRRPSSSRCVPASTAYRVVAIPSVRAQSARGVV